MSSPRPLILASSSPRRRALLTELGVDFSVKAANVDERALPGEHPADLVVRLSQSKGRVIAERNPAGLVLAADTVVVLDDQILGKPADRQQAIAMLSALRGRRHQVYTAVSLVRAGGYAPDTRLCCSQVWIRDFTDDEIRDYVATGDPLDKAGAYAIQHPRFAPVDRWDGCYTAIMGLPLGAAAGLLRQAGLWPAHPRAGAGPQMDEGGTPEELELIAACERQGGVCCLRDGPRGGREPCSGPCGGPGRERQREKKD